MAHTRRPDGSWTSAELAALNLTVTGRGQSLRKVFLFAVFPAIVWLILRSVVDDPGVVTAAGRFLLAGWAFSSIVFIRNGFRQSRNPIDFLYLRVFGSGSEKPGFSGEQDLADVALVTDRALNLVIVPAPTTAGRTSTTYGFLTLLKPGDVSDEKDGFRLVWHRFVARCLDDSRWEASVEGMMAQVKGVIVELSDPTEALRWELERALAHHGLDRMVFVADVRNADSLTRHRTWWEGVLHADVDALSTRVHVARSAMDRPFGAGLNADILARFPLTLQELRARESVLLKAGVLGFLHLAGLFATLATLVLLVMAFA